VKQCLNGKLPEWGKRIKVKNIQKIKYLQKIPKKRIPSITMKGEIHLKN